MALNKHSDNFFTLELEFFQINFDRIVDVNINLWVDIYILLSNSSWSKSMILKNDLYTVFLIFYK